MPSEAHPVIPLTGILDDAALTAAREAMLDVLARQPEAVIVDVRDADGSKAAAELLTEVAALQADWPAARLALCGAGRTEQTTGFETWPDVAEALAALGEPDDRRAELELEPVVSAARKAREFITAACERWAQPLLADPANIVVTEMVNNAVEHARTPMAVMLALRDGSLRVAVRDDSRTQPRYAGVVSPTAYGGRGLLLINSMSSRWGCLGLSGGKVVWAVVAGDEPDGAEPAITVAEPGMADPTRG